jgi:hypothetical protein
MSYKAILEELCRTALNFPAGELPTLVEKADADLTPEDDKEIANKIKGHYRNVISSINTTNNLELDKKFKAGQRTKDQEIEKLLKEKFSVESDKEGQELIDDIVEQHNKKSSNKGKEITDDDVKKHAAFLKMETDFKNQIKTIKEENETKIKELTAAQTRKAMLDKVTKDALVKFKAMNPVLSDDPARAAEQENLLLEKISGYDYEEVDGKFVPMKDGKRIENEFGHALEFDDLVKNTTTRYFDVKVAKDRKSANGSEGGNDKDKDSDKDKQHSYSGKLPKTEAEWQQMMNDGNIPLKDRMAINDHWEKQSAAV